MLPRIITSSRASTSARQLSSLASIKRSREPPFDYRCCERVPTIDYVTTVDDANEVLASLNSSYAPPFPTRPPHLDQVCFFTRFAWADGAR